jgi:hypothetical protein
MISHVRWSERFFALRNPESLNLLKEGTPVRISSEISFRGFKLGFYVRRCKKDNGYIVHLTNAEELGYREVCIVPERGDTILPIVKT